MGMPQTLTVAVAVLTLAGAGAAAAACALDENDVVLNRDKRCGAKVIKATCDGERINLRDDKRACCALPETSEVEWRCGAAKELSLKCPTRAGAILITLSKKGVRFRCLSELAEPAPEKTPETAPDETAEAKDETSP